MEEQDDNKLVLSEIVKRMEKGFKEYGHGLRVDDDTRKWGTKDDSWEEMALEELLDACIYLSCSIIRKKKNQHNEER